MSLGLYKSAKHLFQFQKLVEETDGLEKGRLNTKRRQTLLREKNISQIFTEFESPTQAQKNRPFTVPSSRNRNIN